jgi:putative ABC transport system permease protein
MSLIEGVRVALRSLAANKLRSALTMLGIIIGVAAVIALLSIGQGMQARIRDEIQRMGTNLITVFAGGRRGGSLGGGGAVLTYEDAQAIATSPIVTRAAAVSPELGQNYRLVAGAQNTEANITGVVPDYLAVHNARLARGEFITANHVADAANVVVLGPKLARCSAARTWLARRSRSTGSTSVSSACWRPKGAAASAARPTRRLSSH